MNEASEDGLGRDILNAVGANFVSWFFSVVFGLLISVPLGIDAVEYAPIALYCGLLWFYVRTQIRKGHRRRGVLAGWIAAILVVCGLMLLRIA